MNEPLFIPNDAGNANVIGEVYAANASRFTEATFSEPLTTYAVGWRDNSDLQGLLDFIAPPVPTSRRFEYSEIINAEGFISGDAEDLRAINTPFKQVEYTSIKTTARLDNRGLTCRIDRDNVDSMQDWRTQTVSRLMARLLRNELRRAVTLLAAAATNTAKTWDTTALKDPDQDVLTELITCTDSIGVRPNKILFSDTSWNKRGLSHRAQSTAGGFASAGLTPAQLAPLLAVSKIMVGDARYVAAGAAATTKSAVVPAIVLMFMASDVTSTEDPSNMKRFVGSTDSGTAFRVYEQEINSKLVDISVEHYTKTAVTSTIGVRKLTIS